MAKQPWHASTFARTALPMFGFVLLCWYGLDQLMASKLKIRQTVRGYDKVEEYDPMERLRRLEGTRSRGGGDTGSGTGSRGSSGGGMRSLEEELAELKASVDLRDFDYKPVPRPPGDDE